MRIRRIVFTLVFLLTIAAVSLCGQSEPLPLTPRLALPIAGLTPFLPAPILVTAPGQPPRVVPIALPHMIRAAGAIFAGTVTAIKRSPVSTKDAVATVAITFHVDRG